MNNGVFPEKLKHADMKSIYQTESKNKKENYRLVIIVPNLLKLFQLCVHDQLNSYF